jgi:hypothetical protein
VYVGGLSSGGDTPYPDPNFPGLGRGRPIYPGTEKMFRTGNVNLLQAISTKPGDSIQITAHLSQQDFPTPTNDPPPNPQNLPPLTVVSTSPVSGATAVPTNTVTNIVMSRNVNNTTVTLGTAVTFAPAVGGMTAYVDPVNTAQVNFDPHGSNLANSTTYTVTITTAMTDTSGRSLTGSFVMTFTTASAPPPPDTDAPVVSTVTPTNGTGNVAVNVNPVVYMAEPVQSAGVTTTHVVLKDPNGAVVSTTVTLGSDNRTITIIPNVTLVYGGTHTISVLNLQDPEGNTMVAFSSIFTTLSATTTLRYNVAEGHPTTGESGAVEIGDNSFSGFGEIASSVNPNNHLAGISITKVILNINTHHFGALYGTFNIEIRSNTGVLRRAFPNPINASYYQGSNTPASITFSDPNNPYTTISGDAVLFVWNNNVFNWDLEISSSESKVYGKAVYWTGSVYSSAGGSNDLAAQISSSP